MKYTMNRRDYDLLYFTTYLGLKRKNGIVSPFHISRESTEIGNSLKINGNLLLVAKNEWRPYSIDPESKSLVINTFANGAVNLKSGFTVIIKKKLFKTYKRGLDPQKTAIIDPFQDERKELGMASVIAIHNKSLLREIFNPVYFPVNEAVKLVLDGKRVAAAWKPDWIVGAKFRYGKVVLLLRGEIIGYLEEDGKTVCIPKKLEFLTEELNFEGFEVRYG